MFPKARGPGSTPSSCLVVKHVCIIIQYDKQIAKVLAMY